MVFLYSMRILNTLKSSVFNSIDRIISNSQIEKKCQVLNWKSAFIVVTILIKETISKRTCIVSDNDRSLLCCFTICCALSYLTSTRQYIIAQKHYRLDNLMVFNVTCVLLRPFTVPFTVWLWLFYSVNSRQSTPDAKHN